MILRFSVDDGHKLDLRVAEMLEKEGFNGIFYIPSVNRQLDIDDIKRLSLKHEIGGHTENHKRLSKLSADEQFYEIYQGKKMLEHFIGKEITSFAYPRGWYTSITKKAVESAGFKEARTMKLGVVDIDGYDRFELPVTAHLRPRDEYKLFPVDIISLFDKAFKKRGYFNLVIHSWEIEKYNLWSQLEIILKQIRKRI